MDIGLAIDSDSDAVELFISDLARAQSLHDHVPAARLLARVQLARDTRDLETWSALLVHLAGGPGRGADHVLRAVARHLRVAIDEGPLAAPDAVVAVLVLAVLADESGDATLASVASRDTPLASSAEVIAATGRYEPRITAAILTAAPASSPLRFAFFDACVRLAARRSIGPWSAPRLLDLAAQLASPELAIAWRSGDLLPGEHEAPRPTRRLAAVERGPLDALVARDPRELASAIARLARAAQGTSRAPLDSFVADLTHLLREPGALIVAIKGGEPDGDPLPSSPPSERPSAIPVDWSQSGLASTLADSFERGQLDVSRLRSLVGRGGEPAIDAVGAEMLRVLLHPIASAAFAEILAHSGRPRDVIRLVTYFAIAPDPQLAARSLSTCGAPELPAVLRGWLEAMLPSDGELAPFGDDPYTSTAARLTACVASLAPYPRLYKAVQPLLSRVSVRPTSTSVAAD